MKKQSRKKIENPAPYMVYIMQNGSTNQYKIGRTNSINRRYGEIQTGCPGELKIIKLYTHYKEEQIKYYERVLHNYYIKAGCQIRENGEWFELSIADINFLCKPNGIKEQNEVMETIKKMM